MVDFNAKRISPHRLSKNDRERGVTTKSWECQRQSVPFPANNFPIRFNNVIFPSMFLRNRSGKETLVRRLTQILFLLFKRRIMGWVEDFKKRAIYKSLNIIVIILIITVFLIPIVTITREKKNDRKSTFTSILSKCDDTKSKIMPRCS